LKQHADPFADYSERQKGKVRHETVTLLRQRVMALCVGWEDQVRVCARKFVELWKRAPIRGGHTKVFRQRDVI
jgi:hypothetical protein